MEDKSVLYRLKSDNDVEEVLDSKKLIVIKFTAKWCGPCKKIEPHFKKLSVKYPEVIFCKINVDKLDDHHLTQQVRSLPTFMFFYHHKKVHEFSGASISKLETSLHKLSKKYKS